MVEGRLFYVVGASGAGKDRVLEYARAHLGDTHPVMFAHRYVTRRAVPRSEREVALTDAEFALRKRRGLFVMDWEARGRRYGIGNEINYWLAMGLSVVVKGSRGYLAQALRAYPDMIVIWVTQADSAVASAAQPATSKPGPVHRIVHISNTQPLGVAGEQLVAMLVGTE